MRMLQGSQLLVCSAQLQQRICVLWLQLKGALKVRNCSIIGACMRQAGGGVIVQCIEQDEALDRPPSAM